MLPESENLAQVFLNVREDKRLRAGHLWIYSNEIDSRRSPLANFQPGQLVNVLDHQGHWLGIGYLNPHSLIALRLLSRDRRHAVDKSLLAHRLNIALGLRDRLYEQPFYRLVHGEADGLPGLVVDRYGDVLVVQLNTAGMEQLRTPLLDALLQVLKPRGILLRNDGGGREAEGLDSVVEVAWGEVPERLRLPELGVEHWVNPVGGQKTGWFFDQADNRRRLLRHVAGRRVLDVFSYLGAWGLAAARHGATAVTCVDSSPQALADLHDSVAANDLGDRVNSLRGDAFEVLKGLREAKEHFDVVILDPPAFIKRRKDFKNGVQAYRRLNQLGLTLLARDGLLVSCSCSHHLPESELLSQVQQAARHVDRSVQLLERGFQGPDHPVHPAMPETAYLKALFLRALPAF